MPLTVAQAAQKVSSSTDKIIHEGMVSKKGFSGIRRNWKDRWMLLWSDGKLTFLIYYDGDSRKGSPKGVMDLSNAVFCGPTAKQYFFLYWPEKPKQELEPDLENTLILRCFVCVSFQLLVNETLKTFHLKSATKEEALDWIQKISKFVDKTQQLSPRMSGLVWKQGKHNKAWRKRYMVLGPKTIYYFADGKQVLSFLRVAGHAKYKGFAEKLYIQGSIPLEQTSCEPLSGLNGKRHVVKIVPLSGESSRIFYLAFDTESLRTKWMQEIENEKNDAAFARLGSSLIDISLVGEAKVEPKPQAGEQKQPVEEKKPEIQKKPEPVQQPKVVAPVKKEPEKKQNPVQQKPVENKPVQQKPAEKKPEPVKQNPKPIPGAPAQNPGAKQQNPKPVPGAPGPKKPVEQKQEPAQQKPNPAAATKTPATPAQAGKAEGKEPTLSTSAAVKINVQFREAVARGDLETTADCLKKGADPNLEDKIGLCALRCAVRAQKNRCAMIKLLVENGAHLDHQDPSRKISALIMAAVSKFPDCIKLLVDLGANPTLKTTKGYTALTVAVKVDPEGTTEMAKLLKEAVQKWEMTQGKGISSK